jgi:hypothetical protein
MHAIPRLTAALPHYRDQSGLIPAEHWRPGTPIPEDETKSRPREGCVTDDGAPLLRDRNWFFHQLLNGDPRIFQETRPRWKEQKRNARRAQRPDPPTEDEAAIATVRADAAAIAKRQREQLRRRRIP